MLSYLIFSLRKLQNLKIPLPIGSLTPAIAVALALFTALSPTPASAQTTNVEATTPPVKLDALIEKLKAGGLVLLIRHERTEVPSRGDDYSRPADDCRAQRNLSLSGGAGAQETGFVLRALEIPVGRVISSPMCRSAETARFMFGVDYETDARLMHHNPGRDSDRTLDQAASEVREVLKGIAPGMEGTNIAIISHGGNIVKVAGLRLSEGEIGVLKLDQAGAVKAVGQFMGSDLSPYARRKIAEENGSGITE